MNNEAKQEKEEYQIKTEINYLEHELNVHDELLRNLMTRLTPVTNQTNTAAVVASNLEEPQMPMSEIATKIWNIRDQVIALNNCIETQIETLEV